MLKLKNFIIHVIINVLINLIMILGHCSYYELTKAESLNYSKTFQCWK